MNEICKLMTHMWCRCSLFSYSRPGFVCSLQPVVTRWGTQFDCLQSIVKNRRVIDNAITDLRREGAIFFPSNFFWFTVFEFRGNELMFTWNPTWWTMASKIVEAFEPMRKLSRQMQAKQATLGDAVGLVLACLEETKIALHALAPGIFFLIFFQYIFKMQVMPASWTLFWQTAKGFS